MRIRLRKPMAGFAAALLVAFAAAPVALPTPALAQYVKPRPEPGYCPDMARQYGPERLWWGRFAGAGEIPNLFGPDRIMPISRHACFLTKRECDLWLYWMLSDFGQEPIRMSRCDKGYR
jgi:hypothetical protein